MEVNFVDKRKIIYDHIKNIKKARKNKKIHCSSCIFSMSSDELAYILGIKEDDVLAPCPLTAYVLFIYGFINSHAFTDALKNIRGKHPTLKKFTNKNFDSLSEKQKRSIIAGLQTYFVDCTLGNKQGSSIVEVNKI